MDRDEWLDEFFKKYPELDNTLGYQCLHDALNVDNWNDVQLAELAISYMENRLEYMDLLKPLEYEDTPD